VKLGVQGRVTVNLPRREDEAETRASLFPSKYAKAATIFRLFPGEFAKVARMVIGPSPSLSANVFGGRTTKLACFIEGGQLKLADNAV
jgi:hypothetical protein